MQKKEKYTQLLLQVGEVIKDEKDIIANLGNISALLKEAFSHHWVGFYFKRDEELVLGPFQGTVACTRIPIPNGVCGVSAAKKKTIIVPDVEDFSGHIACSSESRSEIVVPLINGGEVQLLLDIDSTQLDDFDAIDQQFLEELMAMIKRDHFSGDDPLL